MSAAGEEREPAGPNGEERQPAGPSGEKRESPGPNGEERKPAGVVRAVCLGPGGLPKRPVDSAEIGELGLAGDGHRFRLHGGPNRAVCLFAVEDYAALARDGVRAEAPGAYGENLLTEGLDYSALRADDRLVVGAEVVLEIHDVREPCGTLKTVDARFPDLMVGRSGWLCRVVRGGGVRPGDRIARVPAPERA